MSSRRSTRCRRRFRYRRRLRAHRIGQEPAARRVARRGRAGARPRATRAASRLAAGRSARRSAAVAEVVRQRAARCARSASIRRVRCSSSRKAARSAPCSCRDALLAAMRGAACVRVRHAAAVARGAAEGRVRALSRRSRTRSRDRLSRLVPLHGRKTIERWNAAARAGEFDALVDELLVHALRSRCMRARSSATFPRIARGDRRRGPRRDRRGGISRAGARPRRRSVIDGVRRQRHDRGMTDYALPHRQRLRRKSARGQPAVRVRGRARPRRRDDAGARAAVQSVGDDVRAAVGDSATARVRIFTPTFEMPFAGHPTLGTAHVVRALMSSRRPRDARNEGRRHSRRRATATCGRCRPMRRSIARLRRSRAELAAMLGLDGRRCARSAPLWVDTGSEQLVIPLATFDAVRRAAPARRRDAGARQQRPARDGVRLRARRRPRAARGSSFPSTAPSSRTRAPGSACANLGGWLLATGAPLPQKLTSTRAKRSAAHAASASR